jgi:class 3 adenylate cyclase
LAPTAYVVRLLATGGKMVGKRRMLAILMSEVQGSSAMSRDLDPEEWLEIMGGAFEVLIEPIPRYEGTVARLEGDAFLASHSPIHYPETYRGEERLSDPD